MKLASKLARAENEVISSNTLVTEVKERHAADLKRVREDKAK